MGMGGAGAKSLPGAICLPCPAGFFSNMTGNLDEYGGDLDEYMGGKVEWDQCE